MADAGATKTDWCICERGGHCAYFQQPGLNVEVQGWKAAREHFAALRNIGASTPGRVYYYGPALHEAEARSQLRKLLAEALSLPESQVEVQHDLIGAARAAWGSAAGLVGILGTGSNCAFWGGKAIVWQRGGHGYLLSDEGSGADLGKHFIGALLHEEVPAALAEAFWAEGFLGEIPLTTPLALRKAVYASAYPSRLLAAIVPFLHRHAEHPWVAALIRERFSVYVRRTWLRWQGPKRIRYVGGVARAFAPILAEVTQAYGGRWEGVVPSVIEALARYHAEQRAVLDPP